MFAVCFLLLTVGFVQISGFQTHRDKPGRCEPITTPFCNRDGILRYNMTSMPNHVGQTDQMEAAKVLADFHPLVKSQCSPLLSIFLCSAYVPMCTEHMQDAIVVTSCRSMCEKVKAGCEPLMLRFNLKWPQALNCSGFPTEDKLCMKPPENMDEKDIGGMVPNSPSASDNDFKKLIQKLMEETKTRSTTTRNPPLSTHGIRFAIVGNNTPVPRCNIDVLYRRSDKNFMENWMLALAIMCCISTFATVFTFIMDTSRFKYPQRPIIFLSLCYCLYSTAYILRVVIGAEKMSCETVKDVYKMESLVIAPSGMEQPHPWCIASFLILYYFGMAGAIWFVMLSFSWFISAARGWVEETLERYSTAFHLAAWGFPTLKVIAILIMKKVGGNELDGMCYVGNDDLGAMTGFVLVPLMAYLIVGVGLSLMGFYFLFSIRNNLARTATANITRLEKLMLKIGVFSVLYALPTTCVIGCLFYERVMRPQWLQKSAQTPCLGDGCFLNTSIPPFVVLVVKQFMLLVPGITGVMWICSSKTLNTWNRFCCNRFSARKETTYLHHYELEQGLRMKQQQQTLLQSLPPASRVDDMSALTTQNEFQL